MNLINITTLDIINFGQKWGVYHIRDTVTQVVIFVGMCQMNQLFNIPDAKNNGEFRRQFPADRSASLNVVNVFNTKTEAHNYYCVEVKHHNMYKMLATGNNMRSVPIICNETGEQFQTIVEAARAHNIAPGHLSNHLNLKIGFKTLKKKTYRRAI